MFELDTEVRHWRTKLERGSSLSARELDELEDHLRARVSLELELNPALTPAEALAIAREELGEPKTISSEFARAGQPRWRRVLWAAWALYAASFLLPTLVTSGVVSPSGGVVDFTATTDTSSSSASFGKANSDRRWSCCSSTSPC